LAAIPLAGAFFALDVPFYLKLTILRGQYLGLFLGLVLASTYILVPPTRRAVRERLPWYDGLLALLGLGVGLYVALLYPRILREIGYVDLQRFVVAALAILLVLEGVRRLTGWLLVGIGILFILYARFTWLVPGTLTGLGVPWKRLVNYLVFDPNSVLGLPLEVAAVIVVPFVFFGNLLAATGGGRFITDLALSTMGRFRGGPAKMAVVAGSLFGTVSGSAVANVAVDGWFNIPMMKNTGWRPHWAGAIEAVASTGGQLMPPIMGAAAFLIAQFLGIPYREVIIAALVPALLYYLAVFVQVDLEAAKRGLRGLPPRELPSLKRVLGQGWPFAFPLLVLIYTLFFLHYEPSKAGFAAVLAIILLALFLRQTRLRFGWLWEALVGTGRGMLDIGLIVALAGFIIGVLQVTGAGFRLSLSLIDVSGGNLAILLAIVAVANIILGMGMPTTAVYVLLAVLTAPALVELGVEPLAAHLFIFYFGMLSMITPPICMAIYVASSIAGTHFWPTGLIGVRLGLVAYIVPFLFVLSPGLLLIGPPVEILVNVVTAIIGVFLLSFALSGYLFQRVNGVRRALFAAAALGLMIPIWGQGQLLLPGLVSNIAGSALALVLLSWEWRRRKLVVAGPLVTGPG